MMAGAERRGSDIMRAYTLLGLFLFAAPVSALQQPGEDPRPAETIPAAPSFSPVTFDRLVNARAEPHNWLMYSGNYSSQRYTELDKIHSRNVNQLRMQWAYQLRVIDRAETTPLVVDGVMYVTEAPSTVIALDARTGTRYWRYDHEMPEDLNYCCGRNNRGVAVLGDRLFLGTLDAHLVALDARTGNVLWDVDVADEKAGYSKTGAPLVVGDKVITGIAGGEFGIRGFVDAYDAETGERVWRRYTIPGPGEPGNETWDGDSWRTGGSPTWVTGSYDPELDLVYWGTGNPGPDWNGEVRLGDNLYSDCVLAIDPDTGELVWYFQFTPHDIHDWDATQIPVLADSRFAGEDRKLMLWPNRNAFFYVLDRETGEFLLGKPYAKQTWAEGLDHKGRPIRIPGTDPTEEGNVVSPSIGGGSNWWSPSYSPRTDLLYVNAYDGETKYYIRDEEYVEGEQYMGGGGETPLAADKYHSAIRAISPQTGDMVWEYPIQPRSTAGVMSTAGDLVFSGTVDGYFFAVDALTGEDRWHVNLGARVHAAPMSYAVDGKQYVAIAAGNVLYTFALPD
jgi:alcohol dehydrogenase (cytochrome c)